MVSCLVIQNNLEICKPFETNQQTLMKMSRTEIINYEMLYKIEFTCGVRGHHVYKTTWTPVLNEKLDCKKDNREEALSHDKHSVGVFKKDGTLVGHIPIELSRLIDYFMESTEENFVSALVVGPRKREVGLVVPAKFSAFTKDKRIATILSDEILKIKTKYTHFEMTFEESKVVKRSFLK